jgi:hypothetical protein
LDLVAILQHVGSPKLLPVDKRSVLRTQVLQNVQIAILPDAGMPPADLSIWDNQATVLLSPNRELGLVNQDPHARACSLNHK